MVHDGIKFRFTYSYIYLGQDSAGNAKIGKIVPKGKKRPAGAVKAHAVWPKANHEKGFNKQVWAVPVALSYSKTNMGYASDDRVFLVKDGYCYTAPPKAS